MATQFLNNLLSKKHRAKKRRNTNGPKRNMMLIWKKKPSLHCMMKKCNNNVHERLYVYVGKQCYRIIWYVGLNFKKKHVLKLYCKGA